MKYHGAIRPFASLAAVTFVASALLPLLASADWDGGRWGQQSCWSPSRHCGHPETTWQTSDVLFNLPGIRLWLAEAGLPNLPPPLPLEVLGAWPRGPFDGVFSANTAHIMGEPEVAALFAGAGRVLAPGGRFALYGPFRIAGRHTSQSNARFDAALRARDPRMGVRDLDDLIRLGEQSGLRLIEDIPMPVNNRTLIWERVASSVAKGQ